MRELFKDEFTAAARPIENPRDAVQVQLGMNLYQIVDIVSFYIHTLMLLLLRITTEIHGFNKFSTKLQQNLSYKEVFLNGSLIKIVPLRGYLYRIELARLTRLAGSVGSAGSVFIHMDSYIDFFHFGKAK